MGLTSLPILPGGISPITPVQIEHVGIVHISVVHPNPGTMNVYLPVYKISVNGYTYTAILFV